MLNATNWLNNYFSKWLKSFVFKNKVNLIKLLRFYFDFAIKYNNMAIELINILCAFYCMQASGWCRALSHNCCIQKWSRNQQLNSALFLFDVEEWDKKNAITKRLLTFSFWHVWDINIRFEFKKLFLWQ